MTPRSRANTLAVCASMHIETDPAYLTHDVTGDGEPETFCNQSLQVVLEKLGVHLPRGLLARQQIAHMALSPEWVECSEAHAVAVAELGCPVVAGWTNPISTRSSHVALVVPSADNSSGPHIFQAGRQNFTNAPLVRGFGHLVPQFFSHA